MNAMDHVDTVWLTGAADGIGRALALKLIAEGKRVAGSSRTRETLEALGQSLPAEQRDRYMALPCDVTSDQDMNDAYSKLVNEWGVPDMTIANAGIYFSGTVDDLTAEKAAKTIAVNLEGAIRTLLLPLPAYLEKQSGALVGISSVAGYRGLPKSSVYSATKAGLTTFLESLRFDVEDSGVRVVVVSPGFVKTRLTDANDFKMPMLMTPEQSADHIWKGLCKGKKEVHYPKAFSNFLKFCRILPYPMYEVLVRKIAK